MANYRLPYGKGDVEFSLPDSWTVDRLELGHSSDDRSRERAGGGKKQPAAALGEDDVLRALDNQLGSAPIDPRRGARSVAIAINDKTRPSPHALLLPPLLRWLAKNGIQRNNIVFLLACGLHDPMPQEEFRLVVPPSILGRYRIVSHDCREQSSLVYCGTTSYGTPVWCNRLFVESDLRIVVGTIEPHQFAGFSGGVKTAAIGLASRKTITRNHSLMLRPESRLASYDNNPARQDIEEVGDKLDIGLALNAVCDKGRNAINIYAGAPRAVMQAGIEQSRQLRTVQSTGGYDLVICSPGGFPKDINLYQAQKALVAADMVARPTASIILVARCDEGAGSDHYEQWVGTMESHKEVVDRFTNAEFTIGPHKAFQISRIALERRIALISDMRSERVRSLLLEPASSVREAADRLIHLSAGHKKQNGSGTIRVCLIPQANVAIPYNSDRQS